MNESRSAAVIITAKDAARFCAKAVASALAQDLASEVIFVDDGSTDDTLAVARSADDGTGRLKTIRLERNQGPSKGRNIAIDAATAPFLCILDADDFLAEGRIRRMFERGGDDWDLLADDLIFASGPDEALAFDRLLPKNYPLPRDLTLSAFARGNLPRRDRYRRELGFLKPLIRRSFVREHGIRYDERLRLGEDLVYYSTCILNGGRFRVMEACGYHAVQYPTSLSAQHRTLDLALLKTALDEFAAAAEASGRSIGDLAIYTRSVGRNLAMRRALDRKRESGWKGFFGALGENPRNAQFVLSELVLAKLESAVRR